MVNKIDYIQEFKALNCCVIIPTYNNSATVAKVIDDVLEYCSDIFVVNDGSTDNTLEEIENLKGNIHLHSYPNNVGKGHAMLLGFKEAYKKGFSYAITIDSDGQHFAKDLVSFIQTLKEEPNAVIIGSRVLEQENMSGSSSFANKFSNFWFKVETGVSVPDTQSGYRLYPLKPISKMKFYTQKYEFEIEIIVRLSWRGYKVMGIPIDVFYPEREERVSHFRPFKDFFRISVLNIVLVSLAFLFFLPRKIVRQHSYSSIKKIIKEDLFSKETPNWNIATSIGFGVFMGIVPIWGYQLAVGFLLAHLFKLKKSIFFLAANISIPPMIPIILYLSYVLGGYIIGEGTWAISMKDLSFDTVNLTQYVIGSIALAITAGLALGFLSYMILILVKKNKN